MNFIDIKMHGAMIIKRSERYLEQEMPTVYVTFNALNTFSIKAGREVRKQRPNILALCVRNQI